ncbi:MAG: hypothetical protein IPJ20_13415 [Flammeovirgaceae bacterium]|nr:hypothetical protein [Flammeovirgaceae bacterium]
MLKRLPPAFRNFYFVTGLCFFVWLLFLDSNDLISYLYYLRFSDISAQAQWGDEPMDEKPDFKDRVFTGGGFGMGFSAQYDYISVSPIIGYKLSPRLASGVSLIYRYTKYKYVTPNISANDFGISPFLRFQVYGPLFLHAEYEYLNNEYVTYGGQSVRQNFSSFMGGGGFFQPIGRHAGFFAVALLILLSQPNFTKRLLSIQ